MENLFLKYMKEHIGKSKGHRRRPLAQGPVITISREYGCDAEEIVEKLAWTLTEKNILNGVSKDWRVVTKEIIEKSAKELELSPSMIQDLSDRAHNSFFDNLTLFFSDNYYPSNTKIKNTIAKFIHETAVEGNVIIVGRAAEAITKEIKKSFHVRIVAPLDWRAQEVSKKEGLSISEAKRKCVEEDKKRLQFRHFFEGDKPDVEFFNISFNMRDLTVEEMVELLVIISELRGFV